MEVTTSSEALRSTTGLRACMVALSASSSAGPRRYLRTWLVRGGFQKSTRILPDMAGGMWDRLGRSTSLFLLLSVSYAARKTEARRLVELRDRELNPPDRLSGSSGSTGRFRLSEASGPRDEDSAKALRMRTLTNLYNGPPAGGRRCPRCS